MGGRAEYSTRIFKPRRYCSALPAGEQTRGRPMMRGEAIRACQLGGRIEIERDRERERESPRETTVGLITRLLLPPRCVPFPFSFLFSLSFLSTETENSTILWGRFSPRGERKKKSGFESFARITLSLSRVTAP